MWAIINALGDDYTHTCIHARMHACTHMHTDPRTKAILILTTTVNTTLVYLCSLDSA